MATPASLMIHHSTKTEELTTASPVQLVHHIPGRARFQIPLLASHPAIADQLETTLIHLPGVTSVRINRAARSLIVQYEMGYAIEEKLPHLLLHYCDGQSSLQLPIAESSVLTAQSQIPPSDEGQWSSLQLPVTASLLSLLCRLPQFAVLRASSGDRRCPNCGVACGSTCPL